MLAVPLRVLEKSRPQAIEKPLQEMDVRPDDDKQNPTNLRELGLDAKLRSPFRGRAYIVTQIYAPWDCMKQTERCVLWSYPPPLCILV